MKAMVLGLGNEYRGDDGVGPSVVRMLTVHNLPGVEAVAAEPHGIDLLERWKHADLVVVVDAVSSGSVPGTVHRFEAHMQPVPAVFSRYSTHAYSVAEMIELARALGNMPARLIVFGIEGARFGYGTALSPAVAEAAAEVVRTILEVVRNPMADDALRCRTRTLGGPSRSMERPARESEE